MGKFLWEGKEKGLPCWLSQFSKTKVAIAEFFWKISKKNLVFHFGAPFPKKPVVKMAHDDHITESNF